MRKMLHNHLPTPECLQLFKRLIDDYTVVSAGVARPLGGRIERSRPALIPSGPQGHVGITHRNLRYAGLARVQAPGNAFNGLAFRTHSKVGDRYQYLARSTMHNPKVFTALIRNQLQLVCLFWHLFQLFRHRLVARGYPDREIAQVFDSVQYSERTRLLYGTGAQASEQHLPVSPLTLLPQIPIRWYHGLNGLGALQCTQQVTDVVKALRLDIKGRDLSAQRTALMQQLARLHPLVCSQRAPCLGRVVMHTAET